MNNNQIKLLAIAFFTLSLSTATVFSLNSVSALHGTPESVSNQDDAAATYKAKCAVCHTAKAEKFFDTAKKDEELAQIILKGKKAAKPPHMPEYQSKGMTADQAMNLVAYMRRLKNPDAVTANTAVTGSKDITEAKTDAKEQTDAKAAAMEVTKEKAREAFMALYKTSCASCHGARADKSYNPAMTENEQVQIILKGKKGAKPPDMPAFETKGVTEEEARALSAYMIELRTPGK